jgi:tripartite-type tricarboxylate transporter receptor subunit TctC
VKRLLALAAAAFCAVSVHAQVSNERPVHIVVPFAVGGPTDIIARVLAPKLAASLKRPVIVDNKVGVTGAIGATLVAKAPPDGEAGRDRDAAASELVAGTRAVPQVGPREVGEGRQGRGDQSGMKAINEAS